MMRKRSGALHSDSEEGYTKLAELAEEHSALFYDEIQPSKERRKRKYAMSVSTKKQQAGPDDGQEPNHPPQPNPFACFDFDQQTDNFLKDCSELAELDHKRAQATFKTHIVVLCSEESWRVSQFLRLKLGCTSGIQYYDSFDVIDLCINHSFLPHPDAYFIDCFWVINKSQLSRFPNILAVYLRTCTHLWDIGQAECLPPNSPLQSLSLASRHSLCKYLQILYQVRAVAHVSSR